MQTYERKTGQVSTLKRVATNVTELQYEFWFQFFGTINGSLAFVVALLLNNLIMKILPDENGDVYQLVIVFCLIAISVLISRLKESWAFNMKERQQKQADAIVQVVKEAEDVIANPAEMNALITRHNIFHK